MSPDGSWRLRRRARAGLTAPGARMGAGLSLLVAALVSQIATAADLPVMPDLPVTTLSDAELNLPADLPDAPCVLIVGFTRSSRTQTAEWSRQLRAAPGPTSSPCIFEVAILAEVPRFLRGFVIGQVREALPAPLHPSFLIVTQKAVQWRELAGYSEADSAYLLVVSPRREVTWRATGKVSEGTLRELTGLLAAPGSPP